MGQPSPQMIEVAKELGIANPQRYSKRELHRAIELYATLADYRQKIEQLGGELPPGTGLTSAVRILNQLADERLQDIGEGMEVFYYENPYRVEKVTPKDGYKLYRLRPLSPGKTRAISVDTRALLVGLRRDNPGSSG